MDVLKNIGRGHPMSITSEEHALLDAIERRQHALVEAVQELVRINTVNPYSGEDAGGSEAAGQDAVEAHLRTLGAETRRFDPPADTYTRAGVIGPRNRSWEDRPNLVGEWSFGDSSPESPGPSLIVVGHIDTVGVQGMDDPFGARLRDGRIWGRGTSDCKGGLGVGLAAIEAVLPRGRELRGRVTFLSVVDEECNGSGAGIIACALAGIRADAAVSVDGEGLEIIHGCNGVVTADLLVHGKPGHAALGNGVNAIEKGIRVAEAIRRFGNARRRRRPECLLNLGVFHGGTLPAVIPGQARLSLNVVYEIAEAREAKGRTGVWGGRLVWDAFAEAVRAAEAGDEWLREHPSELVWVKDLVPYEVPTDAPVVREMSAAARDVLGREPEVRKMRAWTDSCWLQVLADTPIVVFGPAKEDVVHGPEEHVEVRDLVLAAKSLALYLYRTLRITL